MRGKAKSRETQSRNFVAPNGVIRKDDRLVLQMYLAQLRKPEEFKGGWNLMKRLSKVLGEQAFPPMSEDPCPLVQN